jgi:hypothetical protein
MCSKCDDKRDAQWALVERAIRETDTHSIQYAAIAALVDIAKSERETAEYALQALETVRARVEALYPPEAPNEALN